MVRLLGVGRCRIVIIQVPIWSPRLGTQGTRGRRRLWSNKVVDVGTRLSEYANAESCVIYILNKRARRGDKLEALGLEDGDAEHLYRALEGGGSTNPGVPLGQNGSC